MRLFVAVEVPVAVREAVAGTVAPLRESMPRLRWVDPSRYHLTLVFMGAVADEAVAQVEPAVARGVAGAAPFALALDGRLGVFGRRVLWAGLEESRPLAALASAVSSAVASVVALPDGERAFSAHLTLARAGREPVRAAAVAGVAVPRLAWEVDRVALMRSAGGYSVVRSYPFVADA